MFIVHVNTELVFAPEALRAERAHRLDAIEPLVAPEAGPEAEIHFARLAVVL